MQPISLASSTLQTQHKLAMLSMLQDACVTSGDLLPGLCALAQQWLKDVALPSFRGMPQQVVSLSDWYNDRGVALYLQVCLVLPGLRLASLVLSLTIKCDMMCWLHPLQAALSAHCTMCSIIAW